MLRIKQNLIKQRWFNLKKQIKQKNIQEKYLNINLLNIE